MSVAAVVANVPLLEESPTEWARACVGGGGGSKKAFCGGEKRRRRGGGGPALAASPTPLLLGYVGCASLNHPPRLVMCSDKQLLNYDYACFVKELSA